MFYLFLATLIAACTASKEGVDIADAYSVSTFQCMVSKGNSFAIPRIYRSVGQVDTNGPSNIKNAWKAGFSDVDGYIFPCTDCSTGDKQVLDTYNYLAANGINGTNTGASIGTYWLDVEGGADYWFPSYTANVNFIQEMVDECNALGISCGIYTSKSQWEDICGLSTKFGDLPLWYPHYDNKKSWDDFEPFGGWTIDAVEIKQYMGDMILCGVDADYNYVE